MKKVQSAVRPEAVEIDEYSVWIAENIEEITVSDEEGNEYVEYEFELTKKSKDDYIKELHEVQERMKVENDLALADLAETLLGGGF